MMDESQKDQKEATPTLIDEFDISPELVHFSWQATLGRARIGIILSKEPSESEETPSPVQFQTRRFSFELDVRLRRIRNP